jgi:exopolyphosphatase/guanosine-5'-triphosphate,3'-diphosphate pyrophosphatase
MKMSFSKANSLIIEVGGGSTELMIMSRGKMVHASSLKIGTIRLEQQTRGAWDSGFPLESYLREQLRITIEKLKEEQHLSKVRYAILVGGDARIIAYRIGEQLGDHYSIITKDALFEITEQLMQGTVEDCMDLLGISIHEAEALIPALLVYKIFLDEFIAIDILVPDVSIREGVLIETMLEEKGIWDKTYAKQIAASAWALARRYHVDESHTENVVQLAIKIFDQMPSEHGLFSRERLYLELAAILHDIGYFVSNSSHHKHGHYIVENSEIFGLAREDIQIVSNVVRYHRGSIPLRSHPEFNSLSREMRLVVMKLAAILRVADSLDRSHTQKITDVSLEFEDRNVLLNVQSTKDLEVERYALSSKGKYFEEVYGYKILLQSVK